jgi:hypothetical protein
VGGWVGVFPASFREGVGGSVKQEAKKWKSTKKVVGSKNTNFVPYYVDKRKWKA